MEVIVSHMNIDFDGLASLLAAKKLHPKATVALTDKQQATVKSFLAIYRDRLNFSPYEQIKWEDVKTLILVDVASIRRTGVPTDQLPSSLQTIVYDHHSPKDGDISTGERYIEEVGAAITILVEKIISQTLSISSFEATLFGLGLYTDTGNFTYPQVTERDLNVASTLLKNGMDVTLIDHFSEQVLSTEDKKLLQTLLTDGREIAIDGINVFVSSYEQDVYQGGLAILTEKVMETTAVDAAIVIVKMKNDIHVVTRASTPRIDFRPLLESLGGGGHAQAASATLKRADLPTVSQYIDRHVSTIVMPPITAKTLMASPVKYVHPNDKLDDVLEQMFQFGHTGFPVVDDDGLLVGVISRRDVDKATHHGLGHAPVKGYMTTQPVTLSPDASLEEIQATMMKHNIGRIPIVIDQKMIGILTRTDVIEELHKQTNQEVNFEMTEELMVEKMRSLLPTSTFELLQQVGTIADKKNLNVFLIGGIVRDFFLNRQNEDIDLVVEGDGITFAKELAKELGGKVITHDTFGTATWVTPTNIPVDVVTSRTEYYEAPGQLPTVRASNIREDLSRRDFTINAMALRINDSHFGEILDYYQGQADIDKKVIRPLHTLSFVEDPTRIFRGVRFALRFNYQFSNQATELAKDAAPKLKQISPARFYRELDLIINEGFCLNGMKMLNDLNIWTALFGISPTRKDWEKLRKLVIREITHPFIVILTLLHSNEKWEELIAPYAMTTEQKELVAQLQKLHSLTLTKNDTLGQLHENLYGIDDKALQLFSVLTEKTFLRTYVDERQQLDLLLNGNDLIELNLKPGPHFSKLLHKLACLQLDKKIKTKADAINWLQSENNIIVNK